MYRVFECLDEMVKIVDQAYGVPMTPNCMVPRAEMQRLMDELRDALPTELDDAQDVNDRADEIIDSAQQNADALVQDATEEAEQLTRNAQEESDRMIQDATDRAHRLVADAEEEADTIISRAREDSHRMVSNAEDEAKRLVDQGNASYDRSVNEGLAEQKRLVSEAEVVRRANEEAHRIVEEAHAASNKLRTDCDTYVDKKLAEFESSLDTTLRSVRSDRSALRRGQGASGRR